MRPPIIRKILIGALLFRLFFVSLFLPAVTAFVSAASTLTGLDRIDEFSHLFAGKRLALVVNQTSLNRSGEHITDIFLKMPDVAVTALFGPEHGVRGRAAAGVRVGDDVDAATKIPVYSLYGRSKKPTPDMLKNVDLLVFDMQDIGARFYTFIWTMFTVMQSAAENGIPIVVLDRPNPIGGRVEGPVLEPQFASFIGLQPIPVRHGMTVGELARLFNGEGWLGDGLVADLTVVPLRNWHHELWYDETGLTFTPTSPNMPDIETAAVYPGLCLLEGTNVSEGRGTDAPFLTFGAPWIDGEVLCNELASRNLSGVVFEPISFTPRTISGKAVHPKYENRRCSGARIKVARRDSLNAFVAGVIVVKTIHDLYPGQFAFRKDGFFDLLCGTDAVRLGIKAGASVREMKAHWAHQLANFKKIRKKYLLYH